MRWATPAHTVADDSASGLTTVTKMTCGPRLCPQAISNVVVFLDLVHGACLQVCWTNGPGKFRPQSAIMPPLSLPTTKLGTVWHCFNLVDIGSGRIDDEGPPWLSRQHHCRDPLSWTTRSSGFGFSEKRQGQPLSASRPGRRHL